MSGLPRTGTGPGLKAAIEIAIKEILELEKSNYISEQRGEFNDHSGNKQQKIQLQPLEKEKEKENENEKEIEDLKEKHVAPRGQGRPPRTRADVRRKSDGHCLGFAVVTLPSEDICKMALERLGGKLKIRVAVRPQWGRGREAASTCASISIINEISTQDVVDESHSMEVAEAESALESDFKQQQEQEQQYEEHELVVDWLVPSRLNEYFPHVPSQILAPLVSVLDREAVACLTESCVAEDMAHLADAALSALMRVGEDENAVPRGQWVAVDCTTGGGSNLASIATCGLY